MKFRLNFSPRYVSLGAGGELELRGHISRRGGAVSQHRIALLAHKPHLTPDDASGADCVRAFLFNGLRYIL